MKRLSSEEMERYGATLALCEIDLPGQRRIMQARVSVVGAGALASAALLYLAAAGVGELRLIDGDTVSLSNLQRQVVHSVADIGRPKPLSASDRLHALNPAVTVDTRCEMLSDANAAELLAGSDVVLDCSDNYPTRRLVSDTARALGLPVCFAALHRFAAQVATFAPGHAYYSDIFPAPPTGRQTECRSCASTGVLNALAGMAGSMQAIEAIKLITSAGEPLVDRMLLIDSLTFSIQNISVSTPASR